MYNHFVISCTERLLPTICFTTRNKMTRFVNRGHSIFISNNPFHNRSP